MDAADSAAAAAASAAQDAAHMAAALAEAATALAEREVPVGCIIVSSSSSSSSVLATGRNRTNASFDATRHAELVALEALLQQAPAVAACSACSAESPPALPSGCASCSALPWLRSVLAGATLYVTVEPCIMCADALRQAGIGRVVYGCPNDKFGGCGTVLQVLGSSSAAAAAGRVTAGVCAEEAVALLKAFYARSNIRAPR
jgi:tRNA-specific adenosine deaminase 2